MVPELAVRFEGLPRALSVLKATARLPGSSGVVALEGGRLVGFLLGLPLVTPRTSRGALFIQERAAVVSYAGLGALAGRAMDVIPEMYACLSRIWLDAHFFHHYVHVTTADVENLDAWQAVGFGIDVTTAIRDTRPVPEARVTAELRQAGPDDLDTVMTLLTALYHYQAGPPMYSPYVPEVEVEERTYQARLLADRRTSHWLAFGEGSAVGLQSLQPPPPFLSPMLTGERSVYLPQSFTQEAARGGGLGTALLSRSMAWAREEGYGECVVRFLSANYVGARFWRKQGFRPVEHRLHRHVAGDLE